MPKIVVAGSILVDRINEISAYPAAGELTQIKGCSRAPGGCVPNTACDIKVFTPEIEVAASGLVGNDDDGKFLISELQRHGVDTAGIRVCEIDGTSFTDVMNVAGGERTFFCYSGACARYGYEHIDFDSLSAGDMFHLGYFLLLDRVDRGDGLRILRELKSRDITTSIDLVTENSDRYQLVLPALEYVDNLIVNELEAVKLSALNRLSPLRDVASALRDKGVRRRVIIHMPDRGVCLSDQGWSEVKSIPVPKSFIKGKTGAGDAFCAGALSGIFRGLTDEEILDTGAVAAIGAMSAPGATEGMQCEAKLRDLADSLIKKGD